MIVTNRNPLTSATKIREVADEVVRRPIPSLRLDDFDQTELLNYLEPIQEIAANVGFGVGSYPNGSGVTPSQYGYFGSVLSPTQNRIYFVPLAQGNVASWHYYDCETGEVVAYLNGMGDVLANAYAGGVYSPTQNRVYLNPYFQGNETNWHYIDCNTGDVVAYAHGSSAVQQGYVGGAYSPTQNRIYFCPNYQAAETEWQYVDCDTGNVVAYEHGHGATLQLSAYRGAVYSPTQNRIYLTPYVQGPESVWHYIDCDTGDVIEYTHGASVVLYGYFGSTYSPTQNRIYLIPNLQAPEDDWHYIDCDTGDVVAYAHGAAGLADNAYRGGMYDPVLDRIWLAPYQQSPKLQWHYIDCKTGEVVAYTHGYGTTVPIYAYYGGTYHNNKVVFSPFGISNAADWHYIQEYSDIPVSRNLMAGTLFNKF